MLFAVHEFFVKATNIFNKLTHITLGYSQDSHMAWIWADMKLFLGKTAILSFFIYENRNTPNSCFEQHKIITQNISIRSQNIILMVFQVTNLYKISTK